MSFLMYNNVGPLMHVTTFQQMVDIGNVMKPYLRPIYLKKITPYQIDDWHDLVGQFKDDMQNLETISSIIKLHYLNNDSQLCIIKQKSLINLYYHYLVEVKQIPKEQIGVIVGETKSRERTLILAEGREGLKKIILSSTVFDRAISLNELNVLHNIFPSRENVGCIQRVGF